MHVVHGCFHATVLKGCGLLRAGALLVLSLMLLPGHAAAVAGDSHRRDEPVTAWIFSIYTPEVSSRLVKPFFDDLGAKTHKHYRLVASTDVAQLLDNCRDNPPPLVMASATVGAQVETQCGYRRIAVSYQKIHLIYTGALPLQDKPAITRVGFIKGVRAGEVGMKELPLYYDNLTYIAYRDYFDLLKNYRRDRVDAIVMAYSFSRAASGIDKGWSSIGVFDEPGQITVLTSPTLDINLAREIQAIYLANSPLSKGVWQDKVGLGPFVHPDTPPP